METEKYIPHPIDTSDVTLPVELGQLVEQMSKNVHEVWSETRIQQGWTYGPERNDEQPILAWFLTRICQNQKRSTIGTPLSVP